MHSSYREIPAIRGQLGGLRHHVSEGIFQTQEGIAETIIKMSRKGYEAEQISDILDMTAEEVREIIENE